MMRNMSTPITAPELPRSYDPAAIEPSIRDAWAQSDLGHVSTPLPEDATPFSVLLPPPNVTSILHLGHALNATLQDVIVRHARMRGLSTLWMPGTDHAGIATQTAVERRLLQDGKRRSDYTREAFIELIHEWKDEYGATILSQLQELGASCDWPRTRFTMDPVCAAAVREAFFQLFSEGLIVRGKRLVNWDPATQTALADDEVEMEDVKGHMYYLRYPLADGSGHVTVATTRPETMLGDTGVAINPQDPRAASLKGKYVRLPIVGREIPIVEDDYVIMPGQGDDPKAAFATGFLKVTPAHDPNDWDIGQRHDLAAINVMGPDASISDRHGWEDVSEEARALIGLSREEARSTIIDWFREHDLLEEIRDYDHAVGHSYRSHVPIEPYLSDQWFVRVTDDRLRGEAMRAIDPEQYDGTPPPRETGSRQGDGELHFSPPRYARSFQHWHENLRDWCISRQLWWGHRIPVWSRVVKFSEAGTPPEDLGNGMTDQIAWCQAPFCDRTEEGLSIRLQIDRDNEEVRVLACVGRNSNAIEEALEAAGFTQDEDVLDTWFSSALWPISTMGWPEPSIFPETEGLLEAFNPSSTLSTAREIITLWVSRMVMFNRFFRDGRLPFRDVYIHPIIQDGFGQKMSKSLGNGVDPRDIIESHGTDALRFIMTQLATSTQDVRLPLDLVCPYTGKTFTPEFITSPTGHQVTAPIQQSPGDPTNTMVTVYGQLSGQAKASEEQPLARNSSSKFDSGRSFVNKFWNAARFALARSESPGEVGDLDSLGIIDRWMLSRIHRARKAIDAAIDAYQFNTCAEAIYDLVWRDFCDWYLESIKPTVGDDAAQRQVLLTSLDVISRILHPVCPFVTEALWPHVQATGTPGLPGLGISSSQSAANASWPQTDALHDEEAERQFERIKVIVNAVRRARADHDIPPRTRLTLAIPTSLKDAIDPVRPAVLAMCTLEEIVELGDQDGIQVHVDGEVMHLMGSDEEVDVESERSRLQDRIAELRKSIGALKGRLDNPGYVEKAPAHLVEETRKTLEQSESDLATAEQALEGLDS
ncbi:MAG: valine--tRNA ligase [Phycisphaerae bacterium]|nr:valine--tRNA ligase [Phycisphaerae bacterium]